MTAAGLIISQSLCKNTKSRQQKIIIDKLKTTDEFNDQRLQLPGQLFVNGQDGYGAVVS